MDNFYSNKWNAALGYWVASSGIAQRAGRTTVVALGLCYGSTAFAVCTNTANSITATNNDSCTVAGGTYTPVVGWTTFMSAGYGGALNVTGDMDITVTPSSTYSSFGTTGVGANEVRNGAPAKIEAQSISLGMRAGPANVSKIGLGTSNAGIYSGKDFAVDIVINNQSFNTLYNYGILAGNSVDAGAGSSAAQALQYSYISLDNADIKMDTTPSSAIGALFNVSAGIRAISVQGTSGHVTVKGLAKIDTTGQYSPGIYISGGDSQVHINNSNITTRGSLSNALKLGKVRDLGAGSARLYSTGTVSWDTTQAPGTPSILLLGDNTRLEANGAASAGSVKSAAETILFGNLDRSSRTQSQNAQANFNNTSFSTMSATASLFKVSAGQTNALLSLKGAASQSVAASNGWLMEVEAASAWANNPASATLAASDGARVQGLTTKGGTGSDLVVSLSNQSNWNLVEKANGDKTSTYNTFGMTAASTLNAFKAGSAAFVMNGPVSSDASTINLVDSEPNDVLTVQPSYTGSNAAVLAVDTCLGDSNAPSDVLKVVGDTSGTTVIKVSPSAGAACGGALTTGNGILVVDVSGNSAATFTLDGGTVAQGSFVYELVKVGNNWYLQSKLGTGTIVVRKQVNAPSGAAPYGGTIDFALSCDSGPVHNGSITVSNNQGASSPITVPAGSQCSVTETLPAAPAGYSWGPPAYPALSPVVAGQQQAGTITNTLSNTVVATGMLQVNKTVQVPQGAAPYSGSISFSVACVSPDFSTAGSIAVAGNQGSAAPIVVPAGSQCTVTETLPTNPDGMVWAAPVYSQPGSVVAGQTATATITNRLTKETADLARVPVNAPLALGGLAGLIGLMAWRRQRAETRSKI